MIMMLRVNASLHPMVSLPLLDMSRLIPGALLSANPRQPFQLLPVALRRPRQPRPRPLGLGAQGHPQEGRLGPQACEAIRVLL